MLLARWLMLSTLMLLVLAIVFRLLTVMVMVVVIMLMVMRMSLMMMSTMFTMTAGLYFIRTFKVVEVNVKVEMARMAMWRWQHIAAPSAHNSSLARDAIPS